VSARTVRARVTATPALRAHLGTLAGITVLAVLVWRLGGGAFLDGLRRIDGPALLGALGIGLVTTVCGAWRWALVARALRIELPLGPAVAGYYRALFLNAALPGGVLGDVHRAVRHGRGAGDLGRGVRAVVLERAAGQAALAVFGAVVLVTLPSPVRDQARHVVPLAALAALGGLAVAAAVRMSRGGTGNGPLSRRTGPDGTGNGPLSRRSGADGTGNGPLSRRTGPDGAVKKPRPRPAWPGIVLSSAVVLAGHLAMFVLAARVAGSTASVAVLLPLAVLALLVMGLPLNVGGWGPREGVTAWSFGAAGLGAANGLTVAVVYGVLGLAASLPGALTLLPGRAPRTYSRSPSPVSVSSEKYAPKDSARLARSFSPFSAEASEGRPMTPESV
jgi:uncharacterized membrane protein YbhN (UPF0104 family)